MFQQWVKGTGLVALTGFCLLLAGGQAKAQQGWPINGSNWSYHWGSSGSSYGGYSSSYSRSYAPSYSGYYTPSYSSYYTPSYPTYGAYTPSYSAYYNSYPASGSYYVSNAGLGYQGRVSTEVATKLPVRVNLSVPADAEVWFDGRLTHQTGTARSYESPALAPGKEYTYQLRVQWKRNGKDITQTRKIQVRPGEVVHLALGSSSGSSPAYTSR